MTTMSNTMEANADTTTLTHRSGWLLALGIVQIIAGTIAFAIPIVASFAAVAIFGAVLLVTATFQLVHAFKIGAWPRSAWYGLSGVLYAIAGLLVIAFPLGVMTLLIALEFNHTLRYVVTKHQSIIQTKIVVLIALLAVARKFIILDIREATPGDMLGLASITLALGATYWLVRRGSDP